MTTYEALQASIAEADIFRSQQQLKAIALLDLIADSCRQKWKFPPSNVFFSATEETDNDNAFPRSEFCIERREDGAWHARLILKVDGTNTQILTYVRLVASFDSSGIRLYMDSQAPHDIPMTGDPRREIEPLVQHIEIKIHDTIKWFSTGETQKGRAMGFDAIRKKNSVN